MQEKAQKRKYNINEFVKESEYEFGEPKEGLMTDRELVVAICGTDDDEKINEQLEKLGEKFYSLAIRRYGNRYLMGATVERLKDDKGTTLWHTEGTLYVSADDGGTQYDLYFDHEPDEDDVIEEICVAEGIE